MQSKNIDKVQKILLDRHHAIIRISGSILPLNGTLKSMQTGDDGLEVLSKYWTDEWEVRFQQTLSEGKTLESVHSYFIKERGTLWLSIVFTPFIENERICGAFITIRDITLEKRLGQQNELQQKMVHLSLLAANIAHKMNSPLATTLNRIGSLLLQDFSDMTHAEFRKELEAIQETVYSMSTITNALEAFSQDSVLNFRTVNVNDIIEKSIGVCKLLQGKNAITYHVHFSDDLPPVSGNEITLEQSMINILRNSIEAMPNGGTLSVKTCIDPAVSDIVQIKFEDNGMGILPQNLDKVFDPFFTTKDHNHFGLGLSISYGILALHKGTCELESAPLQGTKVLIKLPKS
jgi:signal transduction histidine kinase